MQPVEESAEGADVTYGYFNPENREYVITSPRTPVKWINYIGTRAFGGFVDHTGGALLCKDDPTFNRITRYIHLLPASDFKGETLYLRLHASNGYRLISPFFVPSLNPLDSYRCHVGLGYTRICSEVLGLRSEVTIFVPPGAACEVRIIEVNNLSEEPMTVDAIPLVEYTHPDALAQFTNADWIPQTMQSRAIEDGELLILVQYPFMRRETRLNYLTSNQPASSFETDRKRFLGENEYGDYRQPRSLLEPQLTNSEAQRGDNIAALLQPLGTILPGETRQLITQLGQAANLETARATIERYRDPIETRKALGTLGTFWEEYLLAQQVETPDDHMNTMLNVHNPYQCYVTKTWSRYLSLYQTGLGTRGIGYRDSMQDAIAVLPSVSQEVRDFLKLLLSFQRLDGSAIHQFNPLTLKGSEGDSLEMADRPHYYSDDHLWGMLAVAAYLKETGDLDFLQERVPYYEGSGESQVSRQGSVWDHLVRALNFTQQNLGQHGLPLLGFADWNDTVNLAPGAESLFSAHLYGKALLEMITLLEHLEDPRKARSYQAIYDEMRASFQAAAWDGDWFIRYFDEAGAPLGSAQNQYGKIYLNAQSWAVISGFASSEQGHKAMESVHSRLNTRFGIVLSSPGFDGYDPKYGGVTTYPPGAKENGGIFVHPNPWAVIAEAMLGNGDRAYAYYSQINPITKNEDIDTYECEPYVYAQNILGPEHPQFGLARNSWLTGAAGWCYQAATQWILGIRPEYNGLRIDPCIPRSWPGFSVERIFREKRYSVKVHNPHGVCKGVSKVEVDGVELSTNLLPVHLAGEGHQVEVWLGEQEHTTGC
jgi:cellobiose phosphorylase